MLFLEINLIEDLYAAAPKDYIPIINMEDSIRVDDLEL